MDTKYLLEIQKETPKDTVIKKMQLTYTKAWNAYNEAQKTEVKLFVELVKD